MFHIKKINVSDYKTLLIGDLLQQTVNYFIFLKYPAAKYRL